MTSVKKEETEPPLKGVRIYNYFKPEVNFLVREPAGGTVTEDLDPELGVRTTEEGQRGVTNRFRGSRGNKDTDSKRLDANVFRRSLSKRRRVIKEDTKHIKSWKIGKIKYGFSEIYTGHIKCLPFY